MTPLPAAILPAGIRARILPGINGLDLHILEAGDPSHPCLLLLHGFPELAFSWRRVMGPLAALGYHVVAPDQRGYGRTTGWQDGYDADLAPFRLFNLVRDMLGLLHALGRSHVAAVVGHDFGSPVAAWCALLRPDVFRAVALMSSPFAGPPAIGRKSPARDIHADLAALPRPRKHYQWYYSTPAANGDMVNAPQGLQAFLRAYYHHKSADWPANRPHRLGGWTAAELAQLPTYYVMDRDETMARPSPTKCRHPHTSPPTGGCPRPISRFMRPNMAGSASRAGCNGIAAAPPGASRRSWSCSPAVALRCRPASFPARRTGGSSKGRARWRQ